MSNLLLSQRPARPTLVKLNPAERYIRNLQTKSSRTSMQSTLNVLVRHLGGKDYQSYDWSQLCVQSVEYIKNELIENDYAPATIRKYLAALRGIGKYTCLDGMMTQQEYVHISNVSSPKGSRLPAGRALDVSEVNLMYKNIKADTLRGKRSLTMFALMVECGMRRGDLSILNCNSINWRDNSLRFIAKGNKERIVFLSKHATKVLSDYHKHHPFKEQPDASLFFPIRRGDNPVNKRLNARSVNKILDNCRQQVGLYRFTPHDLRRTFATYLFDTGVDAKLVQDAMGHANISTTVLYDRRKEKRLKKLMQSFSYNES